jgi:membrane-bound lytic murein transglycosylase D
MLLCWSGRVARGLTRFASELDGAEGEDRFFALAEQDYLRAETKNYVPQIIAAALVAKMPARYGLVIDSLPLYGYDSVLVAPGTSLAHIAAASGATKADVRDLNPAVLRGITPPDASIWARVPVGLADRTRLALDSIPEEDRRGYRTASVSGSTTTPAGFAAKQGVTLKQLRWFNPAIKTTKKGRLVSGQSLRIPSAQAIDFAREIPDPGIERYGGSSPSTLTSRGIHVVKRGETLGTAIRFDRWRYTEWSNAKGERTAAQLFDEIADPAEAHNLAADPAHAATVKELSALLVPIRAQK